MKNKTKGVTNMMDKDATKKNFVHTLDLTKIDGDGSFPFPECGTVINPEDESEEYYKIVGTKVINDELVELVIVCSKCRTTVKLTGFQQTMEGLATE